MKRIIIALLLIPSTISIGGILKYNIELNHFIKQETIEGSQSKNKPITNKTEVHIVGTVHYETNTIKRHNLFNYIDSIFPSVILYEGTSKRVNKTIKKRDYISQLIQAFKKEIKMEQPIVLKYIDKNPNCVVLPYEWELKNQYFKNHKLKEKSKKMINSIIGLYNKNLLTEYQSIVIHEFLELNKKLITIGQDGTIADINNVATDSIVKQRQYYIYTEIPEIVKNRKELSKQLDFVPIHMNYWDKRNKAMTQNILKQIKLNPNKVIVVLNGFYHRYYLIEELKKHEDEFDFSIK